MSTTQNNAALPDRTISHTDMPVGSGSVRMDQISRSEKPLFKKN